MATAIPSQRLPTHLDLPAKDDTTASTFREHPQAFLLTSSLLPLLRRKHPDERFAIGHDSFIYWRLTDPPLRGCKAPDWFYVPDVAPQLDGHYRRSYVMWQEHVSPTVVLEFLSDDGADERDRTPEEGKFWVYEQAVRAPYYGIFDVETGHLDAYHLVDGRYQLIAADANGNFPIESLGISLGVWHGHFLNEEAPWMRWFDANGDVLPTSEELLEVARQEADSERRRAESEGQRAEAERLLAEAERQRSARLEARLRELGVEPDQI